MKPSQTPPEDDRQYRNELYEMARDNHRALNGTLADGSDGLVGRMIRVERRLTVAYIARVMAGGAWLAIASLAGFIGWHVTKGGGS